MKENDSIFAEGEFSLEEINAAMDDLPEEKGKWQRVGEAALSAGRKLRIVSPESDEDIQLHVIDIQEDGCANVIINGEEGQIKQSRIGAAKNYIVEHKKEGAIVSTVISIPVAGLLVWLKARDGQQ